MKYLSTVLAVGLMLAFPGVSSAEWVELMSNGDMEKLSETWRARGPFPSGWWPNGQGAYSLIADPKEAHSGNHCVRLEIPPAPGEERLMYQHLCGQQVRVDTGRIYTLSFWARGKGKVEAAVYLYVAMTGPQGRKDPDFKRTLWLQKHDLSEQWKKYEYKYMADYQYTGRKAQPVWWVLPVVGPRGSGSAVFVDDISFGCDDAEALKKIVPDAEAQLFKLPLKHLEIPQEERGLHDLVARRDFKVPKRWRPRKLLGKDYWYTLRYAMLVGRKECEWLTQQPWVKGAGVLSNGFSPFLYSACLREIEVYGPDSQENLALKGKPISGPHGVWNLNRINDGKIFEDPEKTGWHGDDYRTSAAAVANVHWQQRFLPVQQWYGIELPRPVAVNKVVLHHGVDINETIFGDFYGTINIASRFRIEYADGDKWTEVAQIGDNKSAKTAHKLDEIRTKKIRLCIEDQALPREYEKGEGWKYFFLRYVAMCDGDDPARKAKLEKFVMEDMRRRPFDFGMYLRGIFRLAPEQRQAAIRIHRRTVPDLIARYGEAFLGFCIPEWDLELFKAAGREQFDSGKVTTRKEAVEYLERIYRRAIETYPGGYPYPGNGGNRMLQHHVFEWGAPHLSMYFSTYGHNPVSAEGAWLRGAARQYDRPWGAYSYQRLSGTRGTLYDNLPGAEGTGFHQGGSTSLWHRLLMVAYLYGAAWQDIEYEFRRSVDNAGKRLSPIYQEMADFWNFASQYERGTMYTPIAIGIDWYAGWLDGWLDAPAWGYFRQKLADRSLNALFLSLYPIEIGYARPQSETPNTSLANSPFGDIFDVVIPDPRGKPVQAATLDSYKVYFLAGPTWMTSDVADLLKGYVRKGGTLALNVEHVAGFFDAGFLGVTVSDDLADDTVSRWRNGKEFSGEKYSYRKCTLSGAKALATSSDGSPLVTVSDVGRGKVILICIPHMLTAREKLHPVVMYLIRNLSAQALPVYVEGDIQYIVSRKPKGWAVALLNNRGIYKEPYESKWTAEMKERAECILTFRGKAKQVREAMTNRSFPFSVKDGKTTVYVMVPPGEVRIITFIR